MVPENLELLAELVLDVSVVRMETLKVGLESVHLSQREGMFPEVSDAREDVRRPPSSLRGLAMEEDEMLPPLPHGVLLHDVASLDHGNPSVLRKPVE